MGNSQSLRPWVAFSKVPTDYFIIYGRRKASDPVQTFAVRDWKPRFGEMDVDLTVEWFMNKYKPAALVYRYLTLPAPGRCPESMDPIRHVSPKFFSGTPIGPENIHLI